MIKESQNTEWKQSWNAGALPVELTIEKLFEVHESFPRNPLIADVCYKAGCIDSWGRGVEKIAVACKQAGLPKPVFIERSGGVAVELMKKTLKSPMETTVEATVETTVETTVKTPEAILKELKENRFLTLAEVAARIEKSVRAVERAAKKLRDQGRLKYVGPKKGGHWEVAKNDE